MAEISFVLRDRSIDGVAVTDTIPDAPNGGPPLLFVHGGCHGRWCWEGAQSWFGVRGWRTSALDWFNHGDSATLDEATWLARDIVAVREEVGVVSRALTEETGQPPVVVAHSMGGLAALAHAALDEAAVSALVLLAPVVPAGYATGPVDVPVTLTAPWGPPPPELARQLFYSGCDDVEAERHYKRLQPESPGAVWQATRWTAELPLERIAAPMLVFGAENDPLVPADAVKALASEKDAAYVFLPGAGHGLTLDPGADQIYATVSAWLDRIPDLRRAETASMARPLPTTTSGDG